MSEIKLRQRNTFLSAFIIVGCDFNKTPDLYIDRFPVRGKADNWNPGKYIFCNRLFLLDAPKNFYTLIVQTCLHGQRSYLDLWLISASLTPLVETCNTASAL